MNIVLMAGGGGTRLWPLSRSSQPKQFLDFGTGTTLLELAFKRAATLVPVSHIYLATRVDYALRSRELLPDIPDARVFLEPEKRDTTAAFASVALRLKHLGQGEEPTIFMWCDHIFTREEEFLGDLAKVPNILSSHPNSLVLLGHVPVTPETTLGYIEASESLAGYTDVFAVKQFREKPDKQTAEKFIMAGNFFWNLGYFSATPAFFLNSLRKHAPEVAPVIDAYAESLKTNDSHIINEAFSRFPKISIEYTLIEKLSNRIVITGNYGWSDVGNWGAVKEIFGQAGAKSLTGAPHLNIGSEGTYIYNETDKAVTMIGMKDTIVVVTKDAILITNTGEAHRVKEAVEKFEEAGSHHLL